MPAGGTVVLVVSVAEIDQATAGQFEAEITGAITPPPPHLEIDMAAVTFLDSSGIRVLVHIHQAMTDAGATMSLRNVTGIVRRVIEAVGLDGVIDDRSERVGAVGGWVGTGTRVCSRPLNASGRSRS